MKKKSREFADVAQGRAQLLFFDAFKRQDLEGIKEAVRLGADVNEEFDTGNNYGQVRPIWAWALEKESRLFAVEGVKQIYDNHIKRIVQDLSINRDNWSLKKFKEIVSFLLSCPLDTYTSDRVGQTWIDRMLVEHHHRKAMHERLAELVTSAIHDGIEQGQPFLPNFRSIFLSIAGDRVRERISMRGVLKAGGINQVIEEPVFVQDEVLGALRPIIDLVKTRLRAPVTDKEKRILQNYQEQAKNWQNLQLTADMIPLVTQEMRDLYELRYAEGRQERMVTFALMLESASDLFGKYDEKTFMLISALAKKQHFAKPALTQEETLLYKDTLSHLREMRRKDPERILKVRKKASMFAASYQGALEDRAFVKALEQDSQYQVSPNLENIM